MLVLDGRNDFWWKIPATDPSLEEKKIKQPGSWNGVELWRIILPTVSTLIR